VVILAGYTDEIGKLLSLNPGFASRVPTRVVFPDYSAAELERILELMASREGLVLGEGVAERVMPMVGTASRQEGFGNARYVRNLLDDARVAQGTRLAARLGEGELVEGELSTLLPEDFVEREVPKSKARMGFV
jgi:Cdc6-like AAA superfamily ATPase